MSIKKKKTCVTYPCLVTNSSRLKNPRSISLPKFREKTEQFASGVGGQGVILCDVSHFTQGNQMFYRLQFSEAFENKGGVLK